MPRRSGCLFSLFGHDEGEAAHLPYDKAEGLLSPAERSFYTVLLQALDVMGLKAVVCPKVGLKDIFRVVVQDNADYMPYFNKIDRKHVDFLLCEPRGMGLIAGVELDDISHLSGRSRARDVFVEKVYAAAGLPLLRFRVQHAYDIPDMVRYMCHELGLGEPEKPKTTDIVRMDECQPDKGMKTKKEMLSAGREESAAADMPGAPPCPKCGAPMVLRTARRGKRQGAHFWGCSRFPRCGCIVEMKANDK